MPRRKTYTGPRGGRYIIKNGKKVYVQSPSKSKSPSKSVPRRKRSICWSGYERVPGTQPYTKGSCRRKRSL